MIVLGFDTATPATVVGLRLGDGTALEARDIPAPGARPGHATRLLALAERLLAQADLGWGSLQRIAVGVGPGTFTGLRVGIATAHGLAQSLALDLIGVSSLEALARGALGEGRHERVLAAIDARRGEIFAGGWSAAGEVLLAPRALAPADLPDLLPAAREGWLAVGDGALRYRTQLQELGVEVPPDAAAPHTVSGACICALAALTDDAPAPLSTVLPDYLRRPDAEIALQGAGG